VLDHLSTTPWRRMREWMYRSTYSCWALVGGDWSASRPERSAHWERDPGTHCTGDWVGPRSGLDDLEGRKSCSYWDSKSDPSAIQPVARRYTDYAIRLVELGVYIHKNWIHIHYSSTMCRKRDGVPGARANNSDGRRAWVVHAGEMVDFVPGAVLVCDSKPITSDYHSKLGSGSFINGVKKISYFQKCP
jgi:hypothetical protein